ncbi:MAG: hypothetical protein IK040_06840 [Spirochaetia bacterium]|nr:hypothetical protein [Spirochaetia bacterium]
MKKPVIIAAAVLLALLTATGIILFANKNDSSPNAEAPQPNVRMMEESTLTLNPADEAMYKQIAELQAQLEKLEQEKGQTEFEKAALQGRLDKLQKQMAAIEEQNKYLRSRNSTLSDEGLHLQGDVSSQEKDIAAKENEITEYKTALEANEAEIAALEAQIVILNGQLDQLAKEHEAEMAAQKSELASGREALVARGEEIARLSDRIAHLEAERDRIYSAYQDAQHDIYEYREMLRRRESALTSAETAGTLHVNREGKLVNTFNILPPGQSRNILGIRFGDRDVDLEGSIALMPHWFLLATLGIDQTHDEFVKKEFPGYDSDNAFFYDILLGTGVNWRFNKIQSQPNFYLTTAVGPAWFLYKQDGETDLKSYLLWRSSVGFDLTLHKHLQFTGDIGVDWVQSAGFSARFSLGVLWSFSQDWAIMGGR